MITLLNKDLLYNNFSVNTFGCLEEAIENMAPSLVEYYLSDLCEYNEEIYFNKRDIQSSIFIGEYSLYIDYNDNIYLEFNKIEEDEVNGLW